MTSVAQILHEDASQFEQTFADIDQEITENMDLSHAVDSTITHVWPTRRRRLAHDMIVNNFIGLVDDILSNMQIVLLLHALVSVGRNWDHLRSIDKVFVPTFVRLGIKLFIFFVSFIWAWFSFVTEGGNAKLLEYDELHRLVRLIYHLAPLVVYSVAFLMVYAIVHCHVNNAHSSEGLCKVLDVELLTVILSLIIAVKMIHYIVNFYQISKHTQHPVRRKTFRMAMAGASIPLLNGGIIPARAQKPYVTLGTRTKLPFLGATHPAAGQSVAPTLPDTAPLPNTANSNYAVGGYDYGTTSGPV